MKDLQKRKVRSKNIVRCVLDISGPRSDFETSAHTFPRKKCLTHVRNNYDCFADRNECKERKNGGCWAHSTCKNTVGSYKCECVRGYKLQGSKCLG